MKKLFISHNAKDRKLVEEFIEFLQLGMGVKKADIFCTAYPEMLATGQGFAEEIAKCLLSGGDGCGMGILDEYQTAEFNRRLLKFAESVKTPVYVLSCWHYFVDILFEKTNGTVFALKTKQICLLF